ncbi:MAG: hypothetical protein JXA73_00870 [Acidobacteria bacterium]|nr:hypothetical protein [Acidobacteriota bacterium]
MKNRMKALYWVRGGAILVICVAALAAMGSVSSAKAAVISVTTLDDSGPGSLRQAIADAVAGDTITFNLCPKHQRRYFPLRRVHGTITLTSGALVIDKSLNIEGPGSRLLTISGNNASRVFAIQPPASVILAGMTISEGLADASLPNFANIGGGILNRANLTISEVVVSDNRALGVASMSPLFLSPAGGFPGGGFGGGIGNFGTLTVNDSSFIDNLARGGDGSIPQGSDRQLAGFGAGGGIINYGRLIVTGSRFSHNQAIGGDGNESLYLSGHGFGGAIVSGNVGSTLVVSDSEFDHNQAVGGNGNISPQPATIGPGKSSGGAIDVTGGTATIDGCTFVHNWSVGGAGVSGAEGGIGAGGAIVATNFSNLGTNATISNSKVEHNIALGGPGVDGGNGGEGEGGGLTSTAGAILIVINTTVAHNHSQGGEGIIGGNGLGGGLYDSEGSTLSLQEAIVTKNLALGGRGENWHSRGEGIGGGVYYLGIYSADDATVIEKNHASTSNNNIWP